MDTIKEKLRAIRYLVSAANHKDNGRKEQEECLLAIIEEAKEALMDKKAEKKPTNLEAIYWREL